MTPAEIALTVVASVGIPLAGLIGFYVTRKLIERQLRQNPPISEQQIRAMFLSMGRKPSEAQIKSVVNSMKNAKQNNYEKRK